MNKKLFIVALIAVTALFLGSCGTKETTEKKVEAPQMIPNVAVAKVTKSSIEDFYEATGTVQAKTTTQVAANMMGRIISFPVSEGSTVSRGQVLVEIDNRESQAHLQKANAGLREAQAAIVEIERSVTAANAGVRTAEANKVLAEKTFARFKELFERKSASGQEFDEAQAKLKMAVSEVERAKANVQTIISKRKQIDAKIEQARADIANTKIYEGYGRITSPVSGIIVKKFAESGAIASPGLPLLSIEDNSQYRLEAGVEESQSKLMQIGKRVSVQIDALGQGEFFGIVAEVMPAADAASRTYAVKIDLPANPGLKSGLYGLARFPVAQKEAITIPQTAIAQRGQLSGVFVVNAEGIVQMRIVTTGKTAEGMVEILSGLTEGDEIAISDVARLSDGVKIR